MKVIPPIAITDALLTASNAVEPAAGEVAWNAVTPYAQGDKVYLPASHARYERLIAGTTPASPDTDPTNWAALGPTNRWCMFDLRRNTRTVLASPLTVVLTPGQRVDSLALLGLVANAAEVSVTSGGVQVYTRSVNLNTRTVSNWYEYFFSPFSTKSAIALFDLPPYSDGVITVTLTADSGSVECGGCVIGLQEDLGAVQYQADSDVLNFSSVDRDPFGNAEMVPRRNVPKTVQNIWLDKARVNRVRGVRESLNAVPAVWAGVENSDDGWFESLLILGFYRRFSINISLPQHAVVSLELEEI
jgi:hypothetical protein